MIQIIKIKKLIENLLCYVREDFQNNEKENTFLYKVLGDLKEGNFNFYEQAKSLYIRTNQNPNTIQVSLECPKDRTSIPAYVIREPAKDESEFNSIGKISAIEPNLLYRDSRKMSIEIMCFSENILESILMSEVLYALFVGSYDVLADMFISIDFSTTEVLMENQLIPNPIFIKIIRLQVVVDEYIPGIIDTTLLSKIIFGKVNQKDSYVYDNNTNN